jgi:thimet oligopeptidase
LQPYDDAQNQLALAGNQTGILFAVGSTAALRDRAQALAQKVSAAATALSLDRAVYEALAAVPPPEHDAPTRQYLQRTLLQYHLAGVDKDAAVRARIATLQDRITELALRFNRNVQDGTGHVSTTPAQLDGLPADYIARHPAGADGAVLLSTDEPDANPVLSFANDTRLRHDMFMALTNRAYPVNRDVLLNLLAARQELADLLGLPNYAELATADQMMANASAVRTLLADIDVASRAAAQKESARLLAFARSRDPGLAALSVADRGYWNEQFRRSTFAFDSQSVRPYFSYDRVETGILGAAARIFGVTFRAVPDAVVWHPSVTTFDVIDHGRRVGRIYLDMHPREGKDKWFSSAPVVPGIRGRQMPEGMLICNFSGGLQSDPGLMQFGEVVTYFHEFGHLMHHILGSQNRWSGQGGFNVEGDFIEAPSQMLEEFFLSHAVVAPFARHYQSNDVMPVALFERMKAANAFGRGLWAQVQLRYATYSLALHDRAPGSVDLDAQQRDAIEKFGQFAPVEGDHSYAAFTHLTSYASNYYTYLLDKAIATDFYARFDSAHPLEGPALQRYRLTVINPGATRPAKQIVKDFLGRAQTMDAFTAWINEEYQTSAP